jgi:uncharacterized RDD family membrane protein YckC
VRERVAALGVDVLVWAAIVGAGTLALSRFLAAAHVATGSDTAGNAAFIVLFVVLLFVVPPVYLASCWVGGGATLGSQCLGIRVTRTDGQPVGAGLATKRLLVGLLSWLFFGFGMWRAVRDREKMAWHDRVVGTAVRRVGR